MNLTWHLVKTDLWRQRLLLVVWLFSVLVFMASSAFWLSLPEGPRWLRQLADGSRDLSLWGLCAVTVLLAARLVLTDAVKGSTAFWLTRPISGARLLGAKTLALGLLIAVPTLLQVAVLAGFGLGGRALAVAALDTAATYAITVIATAAFAALAEGMGGFLVTAVLVLVTTAYCATFAAHLGYAWRSAGGEVIVTDTLAISRLWLMRATVPLVGGGFLAWQYLRRHDRLGLVTAWFGTLLLLTIPSFWSWDYLQSREAAATLPESGRPTFTLNDPAMRRVTMQSDFVTTAGAFECLAQPGGLVLEPVAMRSPVTLRWPGGAGSEQRAGYTRYPGSLDLAQAEPTTLQRFLAPLRLLNAPAKTSRTFNVLLLSQAQARRLVREPATLTGAIDAKLRRFTAEAEVPAAPDQAARGGTWSMRVEQATILPDGIRIRLWESAFLAALAGEVEQHNQIAYVGVPISLPRPSELGAFYVLINRARGEAVLAKAGGSGVQRIGRLGNYFVMRSEFEFPISSLGPKPEEWLREATLLRVRATEFGRVSCPFAASGVTLEP